MAGTRTGVHPLDRPVARVVAALLALALVAAVLLIWRDRFFPDAAPTAAGNPALAACLAERVGTIDRMVQEGVIDSAGHRTLRARAIGFCEATTRRQ